VLRRDYLNTTTFEAKVNKVTLTNDGSILEVQDLTNNCKRTVYSSLQYFYGFEGTMIILPNGKLFQHWGNGAR
jgi:hypothetical protein